MLRTSLSALAAAALLGGLAGASEVRATLEDLNACGGIAEPGQRLACYDAMAPKVRATLDVATDEDRVTLFGLDLFGPGGGGGEATRPEDFGKRDIPAPVETVENAGIVTEITVPLAEVARNGSGYDVYVLENGQVWRQKEMTDLRLPHKVEGLKVRIRQGALGSYFLSRDGQNRSVAVERVR